MIDAFKNYFDAIKSLEIADATEHTLRPALENLLKSVSTTSDAAIKVIHEPKKDKSGKGAPDFKEIHHPRGMRLIVHQQTHANKLPAVEGTRHGTGQRAVVGGE